ncbi:hypothetical protein [Mycolicibacterium hippocampi]|uniref:DUF4177 domain-containing protein n=1 Tax=Mycolicibacterium hippocampi TaxID=659824 RepID=A0A7I9ZIF4_9MYCO|nr:hypothetical protein [Mycolicibacterium hippocampi]GFH00603.1 hypothetical protein MHIP_10860 [Mycolicibacterium hippocampi]
MQYECTVVDRDKAGIDQHMAQMAGGGWRLVSASSSGTFAGIFLFWEKY